MALLEILEDRHGRASALMVSQLPVSSWHEVIGEPTIADAICDRIVHGGHRIKLQGDSVRKLYAPACQPGSSRAAGIAPPGATTATGWSAAAVRGAPGRRRPPQFRRDVALGLGPPTAAWHRRAESLPQASRGPGTPPPVIPRHRPYRTAPPPGNDQMSGCPADRELPPHRGILCQPDRGIPIYQSAGQHHGPSRSLSESASRVRNTRSPWSDAGGRLEVACAWLRSGECPSGSFGSDRDSSNARQGGSGALSGSTARPPGPTYPTILLPGHTSASDSTPCTPGSILPLPRVTRADGSAEIPAPP